MANCEYCNTPLRIDWFDYYFTRYHECASCGHKAMIVPNRWFVCEMIDGGWFVCYWETKPQGERLAWPNFPLSVAENSYRVVYGPAQYDDAMLFMADMEATK